MEVKDIIDIIKQVFKILQFNEKIVPLEKILKSEDIKNLVS